MVGRLERRSSYCIRSGVLSRRPSLQPSRQRHVARVPQVPALHVPPAPDGVGPVAPPPGSPGRRAGLRVPGRRGSGVRPERGEADARGCVPSIRAPDDVQGSGEWCLFIPARPAPARTGSGNPVTSDGREALEIAFGRPSWHLRLIGFDGLRKGPETRTGFREVLRNGFPLSPRLRGEDGERRTFARPVPGLPSTAARNPGFVRHRVRVSGAVAVEAAGRRRRRSRARRRALNAARSASSARSRRARRTGAEGAGPG